MAMSIVKHFKKKQAFRNIFLMGMSLVKCLKGQAFKKDVFFPYVPDQFKS